MGGGGKGEADQSRGFTNNPLPSAFLGLSGKKLFMLNSCKIKWQKRGGKATENPALALFYIPSPPIAPLLSYRAVSQSIQRVATTAFWHTLHHKWKISRGWWGWEVHIHPFLLYLPSRRKLQCTLQLRGQKHISTLICSVAQTSHPPHPLIWAHIRGAIGQPR